MKGLMLSRAATAEDPNELPPGDDLQQGALAVLPLLPEPAAGQPIILPLLAQAGLARAGGPSVCNLHLYPCSQESGCVIRLSLLSGMCR